MADLRQGARMQSYNNEIVKCLDDLCERRSRLVKEIQREEQEKNVLESQFRALQERLSEVNASLAVKQANKAEFDKTIGETEQAYMKILESSQVLLNVVKKESAALNSPANNGETARKPPNHLPRP